MPLAHPAIPTSGARPQATLETVPAATIVAGVGLFMTMTPLKIQPSTDPPSGGSGGDGGTVGYATGN